MNRQPTAAGHRCVPGPRSAFLPCFTQTVACAGTPSSCFGPPPASLSGCALGAAVGRCVLSAQNSHRRFARALAAGQHTGGLAGARRAFQLRRHRGGGAGIPAADSRCRPGPATALPRATCGTERHAASLRCLVCGRRYRRRAAFGIGRSGQCRQVPPVRGRAVELAARPPATSNAADCLRAVLPQRSERIISIAAQRDRWALRNRRRGEGQAAVPRRALPPGRRHFVGR